ncbi:uncharacterized protein LOC131876004 [Cryptomeria japonica]|uniref:uncharacterized protein LOC131876004 n=1 Tax=Cryptomeria japonica TaxID=3369 RepID=UPI0027DA74E0|nr:uncharacterized protein LOC131876004 [Cryptomeria japonica]
MKQKIKAEREAQKAAQTTPNMVSVTIETSKPPKESTTEPISEKIVEPPKKNQKATPQYMTVSSKKTKSDVEVMEVPKKKGIFSRVVREKKEEQKKEHVKETPRKLKITITSTPPTTTVPVRKSNFAVEDIPKENIQSAEATKTNIVKDLENKGIEDAQVLDEAPSGEATGAEELKDSKVISLADKDWVGDTDNRRSTSGYVFMMFGGAISWKSKQKAIVTLPTTEAKYMEATHACKEAIWLKRLCSSIGFDARQITICCDSQNAIILAKNPTFHARTNHIDVQFHFVHDMVGNGKVKLEKVDTLVNVVDALTKPVSTEKFKCCVIFMGLGA